MRVLSALLVFSLIWVFSCEKQEKAPVAEVAPSPQEYFSNENAPEIIRLKPQYEEEAGQWEAFSKLENGIAKFRITTEEEYGTGIDDLTQLEKNLSTSDYPEKFDIPAIKSRVLVLKTLLLQTQALLDKETVNNKPLTEAHTKIIAAFNALKKQVAETLASADAEMLLKDIGQEDFLKEIEQ